MTRRSSRAPAVGARVTVGITSATWQLVRPGRSLWLVNGAIVLVVLLALGGHRGGPDPSWPADDLGLRTTPLGRGTVVRDGDRLRRRHQRPELDGELRRQAGGSTTSGSGSATSSGRRGRRHPRPRVRRRQPRRRRGQARLRPPAALDDAREARDNPAPPHAAPAPQPRRQQPPRPAPRRAPAARRQRPPRRARRAAPAHRRHRPGGDRAPAAGGRQPGSPASGRPAGQPQQQDDPLVGVHGFSSPPKARRPDADARRPGAPGPAAPARERPAARARAPREVPARSGTSTPEGAGGLGGGVARAGRGVGVQAEQATDDLELVVPAGRHRRQPRQRRGPDRAGRRHGDAARRRRATRPAARCPTAPRAAGPGRAPPRRPARPRAAAGARRAAGPRPAGHGIAHGPGGR